MKKPKNTTLSRLLSAICMAAMAATTSFATVTQSGTTSSQIAANSTLSSYTVPSGANRLLVVVASDTQATDVSNVTFNSTPMTLVRKHTDTFAVNSIWVSVMGTSASTTSGPIVMTSNGSSGSRVRFIAASTFINVNQTRPTSSEA